MQKVEQLDLCVDGNIEFQRGRARTKNDSGTILEPVLGKKRPRSSSGSPSTQRSSKLHQDHVKVKQDSEISTEELQTCSIRGIQPASIRVSSGHGTFHTANDEEKNISKYDLNVLSTITSKDKVTPPTFINSSANSFSNCLRELNKLSREASDLGLQQQKHALAAEHLQDRIVKSERTYGELLRESLELQRSIEDRRKQIKIERQELEKERAAVKTTVDKLCGVVASIQRLTENVNQPETK